jgi:hypothetical protein
MPVVTKKSCGHIHWVKFQSLWPMTVLRKFHEYANVSKSQEYTKDSSLNMATSALLTFMKLYEDHAQQSHKCATWESLHIIVLFQHNVNYFKQSNEY